MFEQIREIIHEARHIVDYPQILKPNNNLDFLLFDAFLKTLEPSERKAILKKEIRDLHKIRGVSQTKVIECQKS